MSPVVDWLVLTALLAAFAVPYVLKNKLQRDVAYYELKKQADDAKIAWLGSRKRLKELEKEAEEASFGSRKVG